MLRVSAATARLLFVSLCIGSAAACQAYDRNQYDELLSGDSAVADALDATVDATDAVVDAGEDTSHDASDVGFDAIDAGTDGNDVATIDVVDVAPDASIDTGVDVVVETGVDAADVAPDTGCGPSVILNGGFESSTIGWGTNVTPGAADATFTVETTGAREGSRSLHVHVASPGTEVWNVQVAQQPVSLTAATRYRISYSVRGNITGGSPEVGLQQGLAPYDAYCQVPFTVGPTWTEQTVDCTIPTNDPNGDLVFFLGTSVGDIYIDAISVTVCP